jgi:hypothetical protein
VSARVKFDSPKKRVAIMKIKFEIFFVLDMLVPPYP